MKTVDEIKLTIKTPNSYLRSKIHKQPKILCAAKTLENVKNNYCSVARYGDGELDIMLGIGIKFQRADKALRKRLYEIARDSVTQNADKNKILICLPNVLCEDAQSALADDAKKWWTKYVKFTRGYRHKYFGGEFYGDTNITRFYLENRNKDCGAYIEELKSIWQGKDILFVEGEYSKLGIGNDLFDGAKSIKRILCPSENAFSVYDKIVKYVVETAKNDTLIISALGPTATVLCYDLTNLGFQALDLGHIDIEYEWFLSGAKEIQTVSGKSVTEASDTVVGELIDENYESQIVGVVK